MSDKFKEFLVEETKKKKLKPKLKLLDDKIESFLEAIEKQIDEIEDNPVFRKKMNQLLVDLSKEHGEFILALRAIVAALDRGSQRPPMVRRPDFAARGVNPDSDDGDRDYKRASFDGSDDAAIKMQPNSQENDYAMKNPEY